jgi:gliding motility-associated-like protein
MIPLSPQRHLLLLCVFGLCAAGVYARPLCPDPILPSWAVISGSGCEDGVIPACLPVPYGDLFGFGIELDGDPLGQAAQPCDFDSTFLISYASLPGGGGAGPYVVNNWLINGNPFSGSFQTISELLVLMNAWDPDGEWKLDESAQLITGGDPSNSYGVLQIFHPGSGVLSLLSLNATLVPMGTLIDLSPGLHQLVFQDLATGCRDTMMVAAGCGESLNFSWVVPLGGADTLCFSPTYLAGPADTLISFCPEMGEELAPLTVLSDSCLSATGLETGSEAACIFICDAYGICDTLFLTITVIDFSQAAPIASDDTLIVSELTPAQLDVLANDWYQGELLSLTIVEPPLSGQAVLAIDGLLAYTPPEFNCADLFEASLVYELCTEYGCDQAVALIRGQCEGPRVYNGFSPNGDGVNDFFRIEGLDRYGSHRLWIYNRWGEVVFYSTAYLNDWNGVRNNKPLPEGTYFYYLEFGQQQRQSGYLQLER